MAVEARPELVGKRFLCVSGDEPPEIGDIARWPWRSGVIRAVNHRDSDNLDLTVRKQLTLPPFGLLHAKQMLKNLCGWWLASEAMLQPCQTEMGFVAFFRHTWLFCLLRLTERVALYLAPFFPPKRLFVSFVSSSTYLTTYQVIGGRQPAGGLWKAEKKTHHSFCSRKYSDYLFP